MAKNAKVATKSEILSNIAEATGLSRKQVASVFEALSGQIKAAVGKKGPGVFALPGLMKIMVIHKPATPSGTASIRLPSRSKFLRRSRLAR